MVAIESPDVLAWKGLTAAPDQDARRKRIGPRPAGRWSIRVRTRCAQAALVQREEPISPVRRAGVQRVGGRIKNSACGANHRLGRQAVGEPDSRTKVLLVRISLVLSGLREGKHTFVSGDRLGPVQIEIPNRSK